MAISLLATAQESAGDYVVTRDTPSWFKSSFLDFPEDISEAAAEGKQLMVYFGQDGCPYCKKLHDDNFHQAEIVSLLKEKFDSVAVNMFGDLDAVWIDGEEYIEKTLARRLNIQFTPTLLFLDDEGNEVLRIAGYQSPPRFLSALHYVLSDLTDGVSFADYWRQQAKQDEKVTALPDLAPPFSAPPYNLSSPSKMTAVLVTQSSCSICNEWQNFLSSDKAKQWHEAFAYVRLDLFGRDNTMSGDQTASQWVLDKQVAFVPAIIFLDESGTEQFRVDGYLRDFHLSSVLDYVASGAYRREPEFQRFLQQRSDQLRQQGENVTIW
jgi:thioredoxin-related protein